MYNSKLYRLQRVGVIVNIILAFLFLIAAVFFSGSTKQETDTTIKLFNKVDELYKKLDHQKNINSNLAVFALRLISTTSNIVASTRIYSQISTNKVEQISTGSKIIFQDSKEQKENTFFKFRRYQEVNGTPFVMLGNKLYTVGDRIDGEVIKTIEPTFVKLGENYYEVK